jgi:dihydrofolate reductase
MGRKHGNHCQNSPDRKNIVLTDIPAMHDCSSAYSIPDALSKCEKDQEVFVIGGGSVYRQFMPVADRLYITHVHKKAPADIYFPKIDRRKWKVIEREECISEDETKTPYTYVIYERRESRKKQ